MAKSTGLGDNCYVGGYDLSSDILSLDNAHGGPNPLDVTPINSLGYQRLGGLRAGEINFTTALDTATSAGEHPALSPLVTSDVVLTYVMGLGAAPVIGNPAMAMTAKQVNYDPTRGTDGSLTFKVQALSNGFGIEMNAKSLTAGLRTDTAATVGAFFDDGAGTNFGGQAYFQLITFSGTSVTIDIQSATTSGGSYTSTGLTSQAFTAAPGFQRVATANNVTINEFIKVVTTGTFTNAVFSVVYVRNLTAGQVF